MTSGADPTPEEEGAAGGGGTEETEKMRQLLSMQLSVMIDQREALERGQVQVPIRSLHSL